MKALLRYKYISVWMIVVFATSFVVFNYNMQAKLTEKFESEDRADNAYKYESTVLIFPTMTSYYENINYAGYFIDAVSQIDKDDINISIIDATFRLDDCGLYSLSDLYIDGMQYKYPLVKGSYPTKEQLESGEGFVVLGRNKRKYVFVENDKEFLRINGEKYQVTGYISTSRSHYLNNEIIIYNDNHDSMIWQSVNDYIKMGIVQVVFMSDTNAGLCNVVEDFEERIKLLSNDTLEILIISTDENLKITTSFVPELKYRKWAWIAYVFCIVTNILICQYWIVCRKKEFAIKKAYGFSIFGIIKDFIQETLLLMSIGLVAGISFVLVNDILAIGLIAFDVEVFTYFSLIIIGYIFISTLLISIYPAIWLFRINPLELLNNKKGNA